MSAIQSEKKKIQHKAKEDRKRTCTNDVNRVTRRLSTTGVDANFSQTVSDFQLKILTFPLLRHFIALIFCSDIYSVVSSLYILFFCTVFLILHDDTGHGR